MNTNYCVSCGRIIPEGTMVCPVCERQVGMLGDLHAKKFSVQSIVYPSLNSNPDGISADLFFKGCSIHCKGCHNKELQEFGASNTSIYNIIQAVEDNNVKILTLMGGEPLDVDRLLLFELMRTLKNRFPELKISMFTGYKLKNVPAGAFSYLDYIKVGRYDDTKLNPQGSFLASSNQKFYKIIDNKRSEYVELRELGNDECYVDKDSILYF